MTHKYGKPLWLAHSVSHIIRYWLHFMKYDLIKETNEQKNTSTGLREKLTKVVASGADAEGKRQK